MLKKVKLLFIFKSLWLFHERLYHIILPLPSFFKGWEGFKKQSSGLFFPRTQLSLSEGAGKVDASEAQQTGWFIDDNEVQNASFVLKTYKNLRFLKLKKHKLLFVII